MPTELDCSILFCSCSCLNFLNAIYETVIAAVRASNGPALANIPMALPARLAAPPTPFRPPDILPSMPGILLSIPGAIIGRTDANCIICPACPPINPPAICIPMPTPIPAIGPPTNPFPTKPFSLCCEYAAPNLIFAGCTGSVLPSFKY